MNRQNGRLHSTTIRLNDLDRARLKGLAYFHEGVFGTAISNARLLSAGLKALHKQAHESKGYEAFEELFK